MPKGPLPAELYEARDVRALLDACGHSRTGLRNAALIALMAGAGLRVSEALALEPRDVNAETIRVRRGKGAKARTVPLDATTAAHLDRWRAVRPSEARTLISTLEGEPVKASYVRALLPRLAQKAGVEKRVHPHGLRHFYACELARDGYSLPQLSVLLGHTRTTTTAAYLTRLRGVDEVTAERLRGREWLAVAEPRSEIEQLRRELAELRAKVWA